MYHTSIEHERKSITMNTQKSSERVENCQIQLNHLHLKPREEIFIICLMCDNEGSSNIEIEQYRRECGVIVIANRSVRSTLPSNLPPIPSMASWYSMVFELIPFAFFNQHKRIQPLLLNATALPISISSEVAFPQLFSRFHELNSTTAKKFQVSAMPYLHGYLFML
ncbi:hypothetical protein CEXT_702481 [Caerostris extrusa]|uniref:Uncharacterized protein n=1 Tax=Caerostris extrusa TaxID=172846 RepID=A0AAV4TBN7_CAEEX|nr:hypothetical protein CEXT_702481 [Caerostris extrusa]